MKKLNCLYFFVSLMFMVSRTLYSQQSDSSNTSYNDAIQIYHEYSGDQSGIYNGTEYTMYPYRFDSGHPFFGVDSFLKGTVIYDNVLYQNVPLQLDEVRDELITKDITGTKSVILHKARVIKFTIRDRTFSHVSEKNTLPSLTAGFYRILYDGPSKVLAKEVKTIYERPLHTGIIERSVFTDIHYFIRKGKGYHRFTNAASLLSYFGDHQKEVRKFLRQKKLKYKSGEESFISHAVVYYDHLIK